ncbi:MAG TPA: hypothetical protein VMW01_07615 [Williamwhitmania sp.]|nr:hypothetical protein [Williamwhitmania sp.]
MKIIEDDISVLDNIIRIVLEKKSINVSHLPSLGNKYLDDQPEIKESSYEYYFKILKESQVVIVAISENRATQIMELDIITERFNKNGGFRKLFEEQKKKEKLELIKNEKEVNEAQLIKWHKKTYWLTFILAILGFIIAVISLIISLLD